MPQETQQKTFKIVEGPKGEINFTASHMLGATEKKLVPGEIRPLGL